MFLIHIDLDKSGYFVFNTEQVLLLLLQFTQCDEKVGHGRNCKKMLLDFKLFHLVLIVVCFLLGKFPQHLNFICGIFRTLFHLRMQVGMKNIRSVSSPLCVKLGNCM